jgi:hypothetical protein
MHEDMMMMLQYVVEDNSTSVADPTSAEGVTVFPSPSFGLFTIQSNFALKEATVTDLMGRTVIRTTLNNSFQAELDASTWPTGPYVLELLGTDRSVRKVVVRQ